jgi:hypothetical protein
MVDNNKNHGNEGTLPGNKKIPSLFEIEVPISVQLLARKLHGNEEKSSVRMSMLMPESDDEGT